MIAGSTLELRLFGIWTVKEVDGQQTASRNEGGNWASIIAGTFFTEDVCQPAITS